MPEPELVTTLSRLFLHTCRTYPKPELLKAKVKGRAFAAEADPQAKPGAPAAAPAAVGNGVTMDDVMAMGAKAEADDPDAFERSALALRADDLASIIYTSGTTGRPKGVMLTHGNFVSNILALDRVILFEEADVILSFLPLSHVLERTGSFLFLYKGSSIVFAESVASVAENLVEIRPTKMLSVPRLFEKIYARIMDQVLTGSALRRAIFFWAVRTGKLAAARVAEGRPLSKGLALRRRLARVLVFDKILARTGGRVRFFICGGAALSPDITEFFDALGLIILPGYGLTETSPVLTGNTPRDRRLGTVGKAIPGVSLRIAEDGEILARGPNIMRGYYKDEEATRKVMEGGWFHTGDIGRLDRDGFLTITDRKKDIIVTSGGKNVAPQPIESLILATPYIQNVVVVGAERKFIVALVVPDFARLEAYARSRRLDVRDRSELCRREEIVSFLMAEIDGATSDLAPYEKIKKIAVLDRDFEIEAGEITPTLKIKRNIVERKYKAVIDSLYGG